MRPIYADDAIRELKRAFPADDFGKIIRCISRTPTADVPKRKVGKWLPGSFDLTGKIQVRAIKCSCCGKESVASFSTNGLLWNIDMIYDYCPNCGAHMMERSEDDKRSTEKGI